jgi:hypothetical protein
MKIIGLSSLIIVSLLVPARADLTLVEKVEGAGPAADMTIKIKGDKARIDATPQMSTIVDGKTGEVINLMNDQKTIVRISADKMKAAAEMINRYSDKKQSAEKPKLTPTGKKEMINGYEAEEYVADTPMFKASYWIAPKYPDGAAILKQLQALKSEVWNSANPRVPDYRDFPGIPIRTVFSNEANQNKITSTLTSVKQDPLSDADFAVPKDFQEMKMPDMNELLQKADRKPKGEPSPKP